MASAITVGALEIDAACVKAAFTLVADHLRRCLEHEKEAWAAAIQASLVETAQQIAQRTEHAMPTANNVRTQCHMS